MRRTGTKAVVFAVSAVIAVGAWTPVVRAGHEAPATGSPGWRLVDKFGYDYGTLNSVMATSGNDAWAAGFWNGPVPSSDRQIAHWDGSSWQSSQLPSAFTDSGTSRSTGTAVAALSSSYSWAFVSRALTSQQAVQSFALLWHGGGWQQFRLADGSTIASATALSQTDAWAFGSIATGQSIAAYAVHFNGKRWNRTPIPVVPEATAVPGSRNIWAVGPDDSAAGDVIPRRFALAHWTGRWHVTQLPNLNQKRGHYVHEISVVTDGSGGAWVAMTFLAFAQGQQFPDGGLLLHWTGKTWQTVTPPVDTFGLGPVAHDGHGGIWIFALSPSNNCGNPCSMLHRSATGVWSQATVPVKFFQAVSMRQIPGTDSVWAAGIGDLCDSCAADIGVMVKYGR